MGLFDFFKKEDSLKKECIEKSELFKVDLENILINAIQLQEYQECVDDTTPAIYEFSLPELHYGLFDTIQIHLNWSDKNLTLNDDKWIKLYYCVKYVSVNTVKLAQFVNALYAYTGNSDRWTAFDTDMFNKKILPAKIIKFDNTYIMVCFGHDIAKVYCLIGGNEYLKSI
jgi:hypothetical protein